MKSITLLDVFFFISMGALISLIVFNIITNGISHTASFEF